MVGSLGVETGGPKRELPRKIVGHANEATVLVNGLECPCLVDTGSMVSTITKAYLVEKHPSCPIFPLCDLLEVRGAGGEHIPYCGFVEVQVGIPSQAEGESTIVLGSFPFLVATDTDYNRSVGRPHHANWTQSIHHQAAWLRQCNGLVAAALVAAEEAAAPCCPKQLCRARRCWRQLGMRGPVGTAT